MLRLEIGGRTFRLETAAVSFLRYRAAYGESVLRQMEECQGARELEPVLLRLVHTMIPPTEQPELLEFAKLARKDPEFLEKALQARDALLAEDPAYASRAAGEDGEPFDEYRAAAILMSAGVDLCLWYELPILHMLALAEECFKLRDPEWKEYRPMTQEERSALYPRRKKGYPR